MGFNLILKLPLVENLFYNAQHGALLWQHILHVAAAVGSKQGSLQFRGWNCFMDNEAAFLWPGNWNEMTDAGLELARRAGVHVEWTALLGNAGRDFM